MYNPLTEAEIDASQKLWRASQQRDSLLLSADEVEALWSRIRFDAVHLRLLRDVTTEGFYDEALRTAQRTCGREVKP